MIFAFDECTYLFDTFEYNKKAMERTHRWALENLKFKAKSEKRGDKQMLFGIVQGGKYKNLRVKSAKFIGSLPFDGFGIGGSFGKEEMPQMLKWVIPHLPEDKPRHLLGVGTPEQIVQSVARGIDTFDCVLPTRNARHGEVYINLKAGQGEGYTTLRINNAEHKEDFQPIDNTCNCYGCLNFSKAYIRHLFQASEPLGERLTTMHNLRFYLNLMEEIRRAIQYGSFDEMVKGYKER